MIEKKSDHIQIILNDHPEPVRLLVISKKRLKRFLITTPLLAITVLFMMSALLWWRGVALPTSIQIPNLPTPNQDRVKELEATVADLEASQLKLQEKLNQTNAAESDIWLGPVKKPYALQNLTGKNNLRIENISLDDKAGKRVLKFQLVNAVPDSDRITGHIFIYQIDSRGLSSYPAMTKTEWLEGIRYNKGETFAVSRLRPVEASFPPADNDARFLVLIFNREGDLLIRQEISGTSNPIGQ
jgi:hypothetical protein